MSWFLALREDAGHAMQGGGGRQWESAQSIGFVKAVSWLLHADLSVPHAGFPVPNILETSMFRRASLFALFVAPVILQGCGPNPAASAPLTAVASVVPAGGSAGVDPTAPIVVSFTGMMQPGMELYAALHEGDVTGPVVPGSWTWSADRTSLTFTPAAPLQSQTRYTLHLGGGMRDASGRPIDYGPCLSQYGGQWATSGMMDGGMMGDGSMMGPGWRAANGTYGMVFTFTTA